MFNNSNKKRLNLEEIAIIKRAISEIEKEDVLPNKIYDNIDKVVFYVDYNIKGTGILGYTRFNPVHYNVSISPTIYKNLIAVDNNNIPNNEIALSTIVHELTHVCQIDSLGILFGALNLPIIRNFTTEKWANENTDIAVEYFSMLNDRLRKRFLAGEKSTILN